MYCIYVCIFNSCGFVTTHWHSLIESIQTIWKGKIIDSMNETAHATQDYTPIIDLYWKRLDLFKATYNATPTLLYALWVLGRACVNGFSEDIWHIGIWWWNHLRMVVLLKCRRGTASRLVLLNCTKAYRLFDAKPLSEPLFRVRSWNNGTRCMLYYVRIHKKWTPRYPT